MASEEEKTAEDLISLTDISDKDLTPGDVIILSQEQLITNPVVLKFAAGAVLPRKVIYFKRVEGAWGVIEEPEDSPFRDWAVAHIDYLSPILDRNAKGDDSGVELVEFNESAPPHAMAPYPTTVLDHIMYTTSCVFEGELRFVFNSAVYIKHRTPDMPETTITVACYDGKTYGEHFPEEKRVETAVFDATSRECYITLAYIAHLDRVHLSYSMERGAFYMTGSLSKRVGVYYAVHKNAIESAALVLRETILRASLEQANANLVSCEIREGVECYQVSALLLEALLTRSGKRPADYEDSTTALVNLITKDPATCIVVQSNATCTLSVPLVAKAMDCFDAILNTL